MSLVILDCCRLGVGIQMRCHSPDDLNGSYTVRYGHDRIAVDSFARGPLPPLAVHLAGRVDQNSIQIK